MILSKQELINIENGGLKMEKKIFSFSIFVFLSAFLFSCSSTEVKPTTAPVVAADDLPTQISHHTRMSFSSDGKVRAVLHAIGVRVFEQKRATMLDSSV